MKYDPRSLNGAADSIKAAIQHYYSTDYDEDVLPDVEFAHPDRTLAHYETLVAKPLEMPYYHMNLRKLDAVDEVIRQMEYLGAGLRFMAKSVKNAEDINVSGIQLITKQLDNDQTKG